MKHLEITKKIHQEYGFPCWSIINVLKLNNYNYEASLKRLKEIYCIIGDHPNIVIKRNEEKLKEEIKSFCNIKKRER